MRWGNGQSPRDWPHGRFLIHVISPQSAGSAPNQVREGSLPFPAENRHAHEIQKNKLSAKAKHSWRLKTEGRKESRKEGKKGRRKERRKESLGKKLGLISPWNDTETSRKGMSLWVPKSGSITTRSPQTQAKNHYSENPNWYYFHLLPLSLGSTSACSLYELFFTSIS